MNNLLRIFDGGLVKRYHASDMLTVQNNAAHSWGVAVILIELGVSSERLLRAALYHDVAEAAVGDIPFTTKQRFPDLRAPLQEAEAEVEIELGIKVHLTPGEKLALKFADMAELVLHCIREYRLGNKNAGVIAQRGIFFLEQTAWGGTYVAFLDKLKQYAKEQLV